MILSEIIVREITKVIGSAIADTMGKQTNCRKMAPPVACLSQDGNGNQMGGIRNCLLHTAVVYARDDASGKGSWGPGSRPRTRYLDTGAVFS